MKLFMFEYCFLTEHGIAHLRGKTVRLKAETLIEIANPEFRDALRE